MNSFIQNQSRKFSIAAFAFSLTLGLLAFTTPAFAGVGVGVAPDFPATVTVSQTGVAVGLEITNNSTSDIGTITLSNIRLIPSCGDNDANTITCAGAEVDPGIFTVSATGTGSLACAANTFTIAVNDVTTGQVLFTPNAPINLAQNDTCRINFTVDVNQAPNDDSSIDPGLQTLQTGLVTGTRTGNTLTATGLGTDETTVVPQGHIIVNKVTNPSGDTQSFNFDATGTGYNDFALTDVAAPNDQALIAGTYSVSETLPPGWTQTSATCVSSNQTVETVGNISLQAGETVTCTFTNTKMGNIIINKVTDPAGSTQSFSFDGTGTGYNDFSLTDTATPNNQQVIPGAYSISEGAVAGWTQTSAVCDMDETIESLDVGAGETVTCTFTNTQQQGHIIVNKVTNPAADPQSFNFVAGGTGYTNFSLTDVAAPNDQTLNAGAYSISETLPTGWTQTSATCVSSMQDIESIGSLELDAGETITCTFTNTKSGNIIVDKVTSPSGSSQSFSFTATGAGYSNFALTDAATPNNQVVVPGAYTVSEGAVAGWTSDGGVCDNGETPASLDVGAGETVTCTFTNTQQQGHIIVNKVTNPAADPQSFNFVAGGTGYNSFSLTDAATPNDQTLNAGSYSVSEGAVAGWTSDSGVCVSSNQDVETPGNISLQPNETVTCTFTNTKMGHIIVVKQTNPDGNPQSFEFDSSYGSNFNLIDGGQNDSGVLTPGTYSVAEINIPINWNQSSATCSDGSSVGNIQLGAGETITCTFNNTYTPPAGEYCSPGYWKQSQHFDSYVTYNPSDLANTVFGVNVFGSKTLVQVLSSGGGGLDAYGRKAVGALLNASALESGLTPAEVIAKVQATIAGAPGGKAANGYFGGANPEFTILENCPLN